MGKISNKLNKYKPAHEAFNFRNYPFYWVAQVGSRYGQHMEKALKPAGFTLTGWRVGMILREYGLLSMSEISTHSAVKLSTVTKTVYGMEARGLVVLRQSAADARVTEVSVTDQGLALMETVIGRTVGVFDRAFANMSEDEFRQLNAMLQRVFANLEAG